MKLEFNLGDIIANGGRVYRDVGANLNGSYIVTVPERIPFRAVMAPTGHSAEGLPLPAAGPGIDEKVETYVRGALKTGASAGHNVTSGGLSTGSWCRAVAS